MNPSVVRFFDGVFWRSESRKKICRAWLRQEGLSQKEESEEELYRRVLGNLLEHDLTFRASEKGFAVFRDRELWIPKTSLEARERAIFEKGDIEPKGSLELLISREGMAKDFAWAVAEAGRPAGVSVLRGALHRMLVPEEAPKRREFLLDLLDALESRSERVLSSIQNVLTRKVSPDPRFPLWKDRAKAYSSRSPETPVAGGSPRARSAAEPAPKRRRLAPVLRFH